MRSLDYDELRRILGIIYVMVLMSKGIIVTNTLTFKSVIIYYEKYF